MYEFSREMSVCLGYKLGPCWIKSNECILKRLSFQKIVHMELIIRASSYWYVMVIIVELLPVSWDQKVTFF